MQFPDSANAVLMSGLGSGRMPRVSLGSMGMIGGGLSSPHLLDVALSPGGSGLMTLPLPDALPTSTPDMLAAALQHAGLGGLISPPSSYHDGRHKELECEVGHSKPRGLAKQSGNRERFLPL